MSDCDGQECGGGRKQGGGPDMPPRPCNSTSEYSPNLPPFPLLDPWALTSLALP